MLQFLYCTPKPTQHWNFLHFQLNIIYFNCTNPFETTTASLKCIETWLHIHKHNISYMQKKVNKNKCVLCVLSIETFVYPLKLWEVKRYCDLSSSVTLMRFVHPIPAQHFWLTARALQTQSHHASSFLLYQKSLFYKSTFCILCFSQQNYTNRIKRS